MKLEWAARMLLAALFAAAFAGCSPNDAVCEDPQFAAGSSLTVATSCPHRVATSTAVYDVSCLEIPARALAEDVVEVTDNDEPRWIGFGVEGRKIKGLAVEEIFALNFEQRVCGKPGWYSAFSQDMSDATKAELERRFDATFARAVEAHV